MLNKLKRRRWWRRTPTPVALALALALLAVLPAAGQDDGGFDLGLGMSIGTEFFPEDGTDGVSYQKLGLTPDISIGKFGIGLDLVIHYRFVPEGFDPDTGAADPNQGPIDIRAEDWVPSGDTSFLDLYLPKFAYIRWAERGDPLYVKLGSIDDTTLGNGFIVGNYDNTLFLPDRRIFGLNLNVDGRLFDFPMIGVETFVGNLAVFDVIGARVFVRPFSGTSIPIVRDMQFGGTYATDLDPDQHDDTDPLVGETVTGIGLDVLAPIISKELVSLAAFADVAQLTASDASANSPAGSAIGVGGQLVKFLNYGAQLRFLGPNFVPAYFGPTYDLYRVASYQVLQADATGGAGYVGWFASMGFSFLDGVVAFNAMLDGPFGQPSADPASFLNYPHLRATFVVGEGLLPGVSFDASYDKKSLGDDAAVTFFEDLFSTDDAVIQASINYRTGPAVITLTYNLLFDPVTGEPQITSGLSSQIDLF